ncbi:hypothetical protein AB0N05_37470 [Nocardia sp. NPDC051030]|uniref:hypothetical protein n=1 Tax=Nocardia sp. NPDC051030 TaxID=3155162 RepID=UPI00341308D7
MFDRVEREHETATRHLDPTALSKLPQSQQLSELRNRIATITSKVGGTESAAATVPSHDIIAMPGALGELLPGGGLARGSIIACPRGSLVCATLAAATTAGLNAAVVGGLRPSRVGLLAAWEMGARLSAIAAVDANASQAADVIPVLLDGIPLVVLDVAGMRLRPTEEEALRARVRSKKGILLVTGGAWVRQPNLSISASPVGNTGIGHGRGRLREIELDMRVEVHGQLFRRGRVKLASAGNGRTHWVNPIAATPQIGLVRTG